MAEKKEKELSCTINVVEQLCAINVVVIFDKFTWQQHNCKNNTKNGVEILEVCDAANNACQLRRDFNDVRTKFTQSSIINVT